MKETRKTVILLLLLAVGIATFFWSRWRLKNQLGEGLEETTSSQSQQITATPAPSVTGQP